MRNQDIASVIEDRLQQSQVAPSPQALEEQMSEGEFEEDLMDISRSDVDQEEILPHGPKSLIKAQTTADAVDDEEIYKPPSDVNTTARPETDYYDTRTDQNGQGLCAGGSPVPKTLSTANEDAESIEEGARAVESSLGHTCTQVDKQTSQLSPVVADNSDPDEYEPPEPGSFKQEKSTPPILDVDLDSSFSPPDVAIGDNIVPMSLAIVPGRPNLTNYNATTVETNLQTVWCSTPSSAFANTARGGRRPSRVKQEDILRRTRVP